MTGALLTKNPLRSLPLENKFARDLPRAISVGQVSERFGLAKEAGKKISKVFDKEALEIRSSAHQQVPVGGFKGAGNGCFES